MSSSPKVLDLDGHVSREKPYHHHGDCLVWTGPQWAGPLAVCLILMCMLQFPLPGCWSECASSVQACQRLLQLQ